MAKNAARKELRSFETAARRENFKKGFHFGGVGAASVWTYPIVVVIWFLYNAFTAGLPSQTELDSQLGYNQLSTIILTYVAIVPGGILAIIGIFRVNGRWWSILGAFLTWFFNPYIMMVWLLPYVGKIPEWVSTIQHQIFGH